MTIVAQALSLPHPGSSGRSVAGPGRLRAWAPSALLLIACCAAPAATWVRYTSPNFELYTDTREATARDVLGRLELIRHIFLDTAGPAGAPLPVRVFVFASPRDFRPFR